MGPNPNIDKCALLKRFTWDYSQPRDWDQGWINFETGDW